MPRRRLARLRPVEDEYWVMYFNFFWETRKDNRPSRCDAYAWKKVCECFPRLKKFDGCHP